MIETLSESKQRYYHGSKVQIRGGYLQPNQAFNSVQDKVCLGVFVTSDIDQAKFFAINYCISGNGHTRQDDKKIYLERLSPNIRKQFYVYTAYETKDNHFVHDKGSEYYSPKPIQISESARFDTLEEIKKLGYEIYVLDEPLKCTADKTAGNNFDVQAEMAKAITEKKYHLVDIGKEIEKQSQSMFRKMLGIFLENG